MIEISFWEIIRGFFFLIRHLWWLIVFLAALLLLELAFKVWLPRKIERRRIARRFDKGLEWRDQQAELKDLRKMTPKEFEEYIAELFRRLGYKTYSTGGPNDGGIDVIAEKNKVKHYIQCKKYFKAHKVGVGEMRDFYGALADKTVEGKGYFITTSKFTLEAERFAEDKPIELIDGFKLIKYIRLAEKGIKKAEIKVCPKCSGKLIERTGKHGKFLGCSNYPKCKHTENI
jgi:restriction system protein